MTNIYDVKYEVIDEVGIISNEESGWTKRVNLISWSGQKPKIDIRVWNSEMTLPGKGIALDESEFNKLIKVYLGWCLKNPDGFKKPARAVRKAKEHVVWEVIDYLSGRSNGYRKELTLVEWPDREPTFDIRSWKEGYNSAGKGISLTEQEMGLLMSILINYRDGKKKPILENAVELHCEAGATKACRYTFKVNDNPVDVTVKVEKNRKVVSEIESYAGCKELTFLLSRTMREKLIESGERLILKDNKPNDPAMIKTASRKMIEAKTFGERVKALREESGLEVNEICETTGLGISTYYQWARKDEAPSSLLVKQFAETMGVTSEWLVSGKQPVLPTRIEKVENPVIKAEIKPADKPAENEEKHSEKPKIQPVRGQVRLPAKTEIEIINICIGSLKGLSKADDHYEVLSSLRASIEEKIIFGKTSPVKPSLKETQAISALIIDLNSFDLNKADKVRLYHMLDNRRAEIEIELFSSSVSAA